MKMTFKFLYLFALAIGMLLLSSSLAFGAHETIFGFQMKVTNSSGSPITTGNVTLNISEDNNCNGGLFTKIYVNNFTNDGIIDVMVGEGTPTILMNYNQNYYLCVFVTNSSENFEQIGGPYLFRGGQGEVGPDDVSFSIGNLFDQSLNTTDNVTFWNITSAADAWCNTTSCYSLTDFLTGAGGGDNESWNQSLAELLFAGIEWDYNQSLATYDMWNADWLSTYNATYDSHTQDNESWNESGASLLFAGIEWDYNQTLATYNLWNTIWSSTFNSTYDSHTQDNESWNESYADTLYSNIQWNYNQTLAAFNLWGDNWYNHTLATYNLWNTIWSSTFNSTYDTHVTNDEGLINWTQATQNFNTTGNATLAGLDIRYNATLIVINTTGRDLCIGTGCPSL